MKRYSPTIQTASTGSFVLGGSAVFGGNSSQGITLGVSDLFE